MKRLSGNNAREKLVYFSRKHLGKPYKYGAKPSEAPKTFDCSGFVKYLYRRIGVDLPRTAIEQASLGKLVDYKKEPLQIGDLIFIRGRLGRYSSEFPKGIGHVAMFIGNGKVIEARWRQNKDGSDGGAIIETPVNALLDIEPPAIVKRIL